MRLFKIVIVALALQSPQIVSARTILISNDDGLTSNVKALYDALKAQGHDVIVSVPCSNQSGMGAAIQFARPLGSLQKDCRSSAARPGDPGAGPMTRSGFERDFFYVDGTPVMSLLYGLDIAATKRWGKAPDLVISGPNEGQNIGAVVISSGTVSNAQYAMGRGIPAIAVSASYDTSDDNGLVNPKSRDVAERIVNFVKHLDKTSAGGRMLPERTSLNVNFPDQLAGARWRLSRIGTYEGMRISFLEDRSTISDPVNGFENVSGLGIAIQKNNDNPTLDQINDESFVYRNNISVSVMQSGYDASTDVKGDIERRLQGVFDLLSCTEK